MAEPGLRAEGIHVAHGRTPVLRGVDLRAAPGERVAVLGPNGAGKSTLLRALAGLLPCTGRVLLDGDDARALDARERARRLAFVPQQTSLRSALRAREVVEQGRYPHHGGLRAPGPADRAAVQAALDVTDCARLAERAFTRLSCGEQRRVLIARALATGARVLCLDEPTAALDIAHVLQLYTLLRRLSGEGYALVLVLHALDEALEHADHALLIADGAVARSGPVREVVSADPVRAVYRVELHERPGLGFRPCAED
jgi:iron complex transport system ATP-binding protein